MAQSSENVLPTLRDFFNSKKPGEEDEFMFYRTFNSSSKKPPKPGDKAKERHGFFNQGSKERSRRNISDAEKFSVEQYSSGGFFGVRLNTNGRQQQQQQRSAKPLGSEKNMEPRLQKSFSARMQLSFMPSSKGSNQSSSTNTSSSTSWFSRIKKMSNPFSNRNPLIPKSGDINGEMVSRNKSLRKSSPVHLHAHLSMEYELGMPVFTFSLDRPDDVYMASTWTDDNESRFVYSFRYVGGRSNKNLGEQRLIVSGKESSVIGQMQVSTKICIESEPYEEDLVESTVSEFVLFDMARARRSGFKNDKLSRQNSFRRGLDPSQSIFSETENTASDLLPRQNSFSRGLIRSLSKHSENTVSDPWPASELHPGLEIAAIVIQDSSSYSKLSSREMKVIVPTGNHGLPDTDNSCPTPILQRWRSGGGCDCSGWDMGCHLFVLESPDTHFAEKPELINNHHGLELYIEGEKEITPAMTMAFIREGHYEVNFHAKLSALQAFSVCVAELHRTAVSRGERSNSLSRCSSLRELIDMETPVNTREVLSSFMPNVTFSPISRV